ncbi:HAD family hydrolase [Trichlorobacter ammonificans]|uniref:HAD family hydrolase n=1 Tax=Trichlorobacter ammonificans TaxID=2916410 RepID=A0ABM9D4W9_9BACT|nr:HAD family phosphatase [Trichlorobacter ammonificans]CAH2030297.1 HAD family hydrolase [Trichlorobacter ammonificans]
MYPQSVIFDFDGVIVDTEPLHYRAFQELLTPLGLGYSWEEYCRTYMGFDDRDAFREAFAVGGRPLPREELERLIERKAELFQEIVAQGVPPYPGVVALIRRLRAEEVPLAVCSGALRSDIEPILAGLAIGDCFSCIVTAEDVEHSKPDPASYRLAFEKLRTLYPELRDAEHSCAIEDTPAGIASATGAGLRVVAVTNSYSADRLAQANLVVTSLEELPARFGELPTA